MARDKLANLLPLLPAVPIVLLVALLYHDLPFYDEWMFSHTIHRFEAEGLSWGLLIEPHNEHRIAVARGLLLALVYLTDWNTWYEVALLLAVTLSVVPLLRFLASPPDRRRDAPLPPLFWVAAAALVFSVNAYGCWLWPWLLSNQLAMAFSVLALGLLAHSGAGLRSVVLAGVAAFAGSFSAGFGVCVWPVGVAYLALARGNSRRWLRLATWCGLGLVCFVLYGGGGAARSPGGAVPSVLQMAGYLVRWLGSGVAGQSRIAASLSGVGFLVWSLGLGALVATRPSFRTGELAPWALLYGYALCVAVLTTIGRASMGVDQAMSPRYVPFSALGWVALAGLTASALRAARAEGVRVPAWAKVWGPVVLVWLLSVPFQVRSLGYARGRSAKMAACKERILASRPLGPELERFLYPDPSWARENELLFAPRGWSHFRGRAQADPGRGPR
ncbi:MAG: hypothetical protein R3F30_08250 [Planctomycetota bacterium]